MKNLGLLIVWRVQRILSMHWRQAEGKSACRRYEYYESLYMGLLTYSVIGQISLLVLVEMLQEHLYNAFLCFWQHHNQSFLIAHFDININIHKYAVKNIRNMFVKWDSPDQESADIIVWSVHVDIMFLQSIQRHKRQPKW